MTPPRHDTPQLQDAIADAISTATRGAGRVNILVAGKTGVGKSTLINAVFRGDLAKTGAGKPVTQTTQEFSRPGHPLTIIDTRGLEVGDYARSRQQLADLIRERAASDDQDRHLHVAWLCIQDSSHRVEDAEIELCALLADAGIPVIGVLTKARKNSPFLEQARALLPRARQVVAVRALPERIEELDADLPPMGMNFSRPDTSERPTSVAADAPSVDVTSVLMAAVFNSMPKVMPILAIMPTWIGTSATASENGIGAAAAEAASPAATFTSISARFFFTSRAFWLRVESALA